MNKKGVEIYISLTNILIKYIDQFKSESEETFAELVKDINSNNSVSIIPSYSDFVEQVCHSTYRHSIAAFTTILEKMCNNIADETGSTFVKFEEKIKLLENQISELEEKLNSK